MSLQREDFPLPDILWEPTREYWQSAARGELRIPRCTHCQHWTWYPKPGCPQCDRKEFRWTALSGRARLFSFVVVRHAFLPQYKDMTPFIPALVVPEEAPGVRLATRIVGSPPEQIYIEMPLEVVFEPLRFAGVEASVTAPLFRASP